MKFVPQKLAGLWLLEPERFADFRGYFARTYCAEEFARHGLPTAWVQGSVSFNAKRHTLRGMHWQAVPHGEGKLVRCPRGKIFDVAVDVRPESPTFRQWLGFELSPENGNQLYIPDGFAHGFATLEDDTEVAYQITQTHHPESARGARWNDPAFGITWPPAENWIMAERDRNYPDFKP